MFDTILDAQTAFDNSGVAEMFYTAWYAGDDEEFDARIEAVVEWMWRNDKTANEAAFHFNVVD